MNLLIQSAMIFFGTMMAAGLVALGDPARTHFTMAASPANASSFVASAQPQR